MAGSLNALFPAADPGAVQKGVGHPELLPTPGHDRNQALAPGRTDRCHSGPMTEKFNADFYVTCATVIPVLFLAAAVQGQAFVFLLHRAGRGTARQRQWITRRFFRFRVAAIVIAGIVGEPIALWALYRESERPWQGPTVLVATLILLLAVAAAPIGAYADQIAQLLDQALEGPPELAAPGEDEAPGDQRGEQSRQ